MSSAATSAWPSPSTSHMASSARPSPSKSMLTASRVPSASRSRSAALDQRLNVPSPGPNTYSIKGSTRHQTFSGAGWFRYGLPKIPQDAARCVL
ncbi:hypothetical protein A5788_11590 [Gordonia sp. 852002-50816_SCH5313054-c]|nr:hypothetical protein A5786_10370 [Gordonia sp. 852002-50816_SCH5313054-a]OBC17835.1 hypothetical protein A5788_11590 [Gordonia sp. 852002-50816_SCH5313054-c]